MTGGLGLCMSGRASLRLFAISCFFIETNCGSKWPGKTGMGNKVIPVRSANGQGVMEEEAK